MTTDAELRTFAEALAGEEWEAYFTVHGDPHVVEKGKPWPQHAVAAVSTAPEDYGRDRARFIGAADPATVLALLDRVDAVRRYMQDALEVFVRNDIKGTPAVGVADVLRLIGGDE